MLTAGGRRFLRLRNAGEVLVRWFQPSGGDTGKYQADHGRHPPLSLPQTHGTVRSQMPRLPVEVHPDVDSILRQLERVILLLNHQHEGEEAKASPCPSKPRHKLLRCYRRIQDQSCCAWLLRANSERRLTRSRRSSPERLPSPCSAGVLTQDGIPVTARYGSWNASTSGFRLPVQPRSLEDTGSPTQRCPRRPCSRRETGCPARVLPRSDRRVPWCSGSGTKSCLLRM